MFFSVIIPVYNVENYLKECVDSILCQTFTDFEVILVNDGSKDNSGAICDEYAAKDNRVKVIHQLNGGLSDARNSGTKIATGDYIIFIDSDDYIASNDFLFKISEKAKENYDVICYKFKKYFESTKEFSKCSFNIPEIENYKTLSERVLYLVKQDAFYCSAWSKAIRRSIVVDNNIFFEKGIVSEDQEWYYHIMLKIKNITGIDEAFLVYRQRSNSITSSVGIKNLSDTVYLLEKWYKTLTESNIEEDYKNALLNSLAKLYCNLLILYSNFKDKSKNEYKMRTKKLAVLLKYNNNPRTAIFSKLYKVSGFYGLYFTLKILNKLRKR